MSKLQLFVIKLIKILISFSMHHPFFQMLYMYIPELFPTKMRSKGLAFSSFIGYLGILISPYITAFLVSIL